MAERKTKYSGVYLRDDGKYRLVITAKHPITNKIQYRRKTISAKSALAASRIRETELALFRKELSNSGGVSPLGETIEEFSDRWFKMMLRKNRNRDHVIKKNQETIRDFVLPILGKVKVSEITRKHVVFWAEKAEEFRKKKDGSDYSSASRAKWWRVLRSMIRDMVNHSNLSVDPTLGYTYKPVGKAPKKKESMNVEEAKRYFDSLTVVSARDRIMLAILLTTGIRFGELTALEWEDVDFEAGSIRIHKSQVKGKVYNTKTNKERTLPLAPAVAAWLKEYAGDKKTGFCFEASNGKFVESSSVTNSHRKVLKQAGIKKHVQIHGLRRTFNDLMRKSAGDIVTRSMTGHVTEEMTEHYSTVDLDEKREAHREAMAQVIPLVAKKAQS